MKEVAISASTGSKKDGTWKEFKGKAPEYESIEEVVKLLKKEAVLVLINRQVKTEELNKLRKPAVDPYARLVAKAPPEAQDQIKAILAKYGLKA